eukprot:TRINITY_DN17937_c0_g1_i1.p1 TRINITY_DN17937_c0_g1~~TRINITY_DN17937_c0_g1_i1.p1  ORF type:complete len:221 (+),score=45.38 TRINITY_DN17937_c0_g1_i1:37-663(+)
MNKQIIEETELINYVNVINDKYSKNLNITQYASNINKVMNEEFLFMNINRGVSEGDGKVFWILNNTKDDVNSKKMSKYTEKQREVYKIIIDLILKKFPKTKIGSIELLNEVKGFKKTELEFLLEKLCEDMWLAKKKGRIYLGLRTIIELKEYVLSELSNSESEYPKCVSCKELVVKPKICLHCKKNKTETFLHKRCKKDVCPSCKTKF